MKKEIEKDKLIEILTLAIGIALLPPLWAVLSPYMGISVGAVALVCAALFVANGNKVEDSVKICLGYIIGLVWGIIALDTISVINFNKDIVQFLVLFVLGGLAVILSSTVMKKIVYLPSWLCGWALSLGMLGGLPKEQWITMEIQIAISMVTGVIYIGVGVLKCQQFIIKKIK